MLLQHMHLFVNPEVHNWDLAVFRPHGQNLIAEEVLDSQPLLRYFEIKRESVLLNIENPQTAVLLTDGEARAVWIVPDTGGQGVKVDRQ